MLMVMVMAVVVAVTTMPADVTRLHHHGRQRDTVA